MNMIKGQVLHKSNEPIEDSPTLVMTNPNTPKPTTNSPSLTAFSQIANKKRKATETLQIEIHSSTPTLRVASSTKKEVAKTKQWVRLSAMIIVADIWLGG